MSRLVLLIIDSGITENWHSASFHRHIGFCDAVIMHSMASSRVAMYWSSVWCCILLAEAVPRHGDSLLPVTLISAVSNSGFFPRYP